MAAILNRFLYALKMDKEPAATAAAAPAELESSGKRWFDSGKYEEELENNGFSVVDTGVEMVKEPVNSGKFSSISGKKAVINMDNRWKSARNGSKSRPISLYGAAFCGAVVVSALYMTYMEAELLLQICTYMIAIAAFIALDPFNLVSRLLAKASRFLVAATLLLITFCQIANEEQLWIVCGIACLILIGLAAALNDFWIKSENWNMSKEVEHALHGDPDNRAGTAWQADGRRSTRTALYSIGVTVSDVDLDTVMKAAYHVGFWSCYSFQQDQSKRIKDLEWQIVLLNSNIKTETDEKIEALEEEKEKLIEQYRQLAAEYDNLVDDYNGLVEQIEEQEEEAAELPEDPVEEELLPDLLPKGVTAEQYLQVCSLLDEEEADRSIERITGVSRYKINQIKAMREPSNIVNMAMAANA